MDSTEERRTKTGMRLGTFWYASPEQLDNAKGVDERTDIYALGMVLYELLSGRLPWDRDVSEPQILLQKVKGDLIPLRDVSKEIPDFLLDIVDSCLSLEKEKRPKSTLEMWNVLNREKAMNQRVERPTTVTAEVQKDVEKGRKREKKTIGK